ncbi:hypothetical protein ACPPVS_04940 [Cellulomonas sp. McL0617]|uniref:hypothetical protein n=1 Tax=Cellulomonas sp. McL0617 TaxID=3415675 RepID=UPI003CFAB37C
MAYTRPQSCMMCGKPTTRLLGVIAGVEASEGGGGSIRSTVLGYCAAHRDEVLPRYLFELGDAGQVTLITDPPAKLRSIDADDFLAWADVETAQHLSNWSGHETIQPVDGPDAVPAACMHCGGLLSWGTGPHVPDAALRERAIAWECLACGAAGMMMNVR